MNETSFCSATLHLPLLPSSSPRLASFSSLHFFFLAKSHFLISVLWHSPFTSNCSPQPSLLHPAVTVPLPYPTERPLSYCQFFSHWHEAWLKLSVISYRPTYIHFINVSVSLCFMKQNTFRVMSMNTNYCSVLPS